jgi:phage antirepressor YoqD-like protein
LFPNCISVRKFAEQLSIQVGYGITQKDIIDWLKEKKYLMSSKYCEPYKKYLEKKWFTFIMIISTIDKDKHISEEMGITKEAQKKLIELFISERA